MTATGPATDAGADLAASLRAAYSGSADAWESGPTTQLYGPLARAIVDRASLELSARTFIDLGAGTGALTRALEAVGASVVALDFARGMLVHDRRNRPPAVVADATRLPVRAASVDGLASAFCFNHLPDPLAGMREAVRVVRPGGTVLVATFAADAPHPAKDIVDRVAETHGFQPPAWHLDLKVRVERLTASAPRLARLATAAGLAVVEATELDVPVGLDSPAALARWRLGMASLVPFLESLPGDRRDAVEADAVAALTEHPGSAVPHVPRLAVLSARVPPA